MKILSIETSCDETGVSILEAKGGTKNTSFIVLANALSSQVKIHAEYGGVYPMMAKREHIKNLPILLKRVLLKAKIQKNFMRAESGGNPGIDIIAVTSGPGLEPALWTGIVFAQELAKKWNVPAVPVNHMEGHILSVFGKQKGKFSIPKTNFPALSLLVSGGHTELVLVENWMKYKVIGETLDDAAGEAFDKVARMMNLPYPGGPQISRLAEVERASLRKYVGSGSLGRSDGDGQRKFSTENFRADRTNILSNPIKLPRPMMYSKNFDFSFSGLKTAVLYLIRKIGKPDDKTKSAIALEFENAVVETLIYKTKKAIEKYKIKTLIVAGGVSGNIHLKRTIGKEFGDIEILFPNKGLTTDNSIMIGMVGYLKYLQKKGKFGNPKNIKAEGGLRL
jgi:N6-L-threonylcarbamoyladenine synthase